MELLIVSISYRCYRGLNEVIIAKQNLAQCLEQSKLFLYYFITAVVVLTVILNSFLTGLLPQGYHSSPIHLLGHFQEAAFSKIFLGYKIHISLEKSQKI